MNNPYEMLPEPSQPLSEVSFAQLPGSLRDAAARAGWSTLMPVQARAIPYLFAGRNMMIQARTGSGKTGAYLLPMIEKLNPRLEACQALDSGADPRAGQAGLAGGRDAVRPGGAARAGDLRRRGLTARRSTGCCQGAHIVVGTPGRVLDHLLKRTLSLDKLVMMIYDEADRMLSMGFYPDMKEVQRYLPDAEINVSMFSATFPVSVMRTAREFMRAPEYLTLSSDHVHVTDTEHIYYLVPGLDKDRGLVRIIEIENPVSAIIFCNTKVKVHYVTVVLQRFGYDADELSADLSQQDRERVLERVRKGTLRFLVATDVAARGLDIPELSHVFQYELPEDTEAYIHRAGRTGRAGAAGVAMSLVNYGEKHLLSRIIAQYGIEMEERNLPTDEDVEAVVAERLIALLEARLRERDKLQTERSRRLIPLARSLAEIEDEAAVMTMLLDDTYQQMLHAPTPQPGGSTPTPPKPRPARRSDEGGQRRRRTGGPRRR